jgi:DNA-binding winged helix-turn-helix (wHTH) protein
MQGESEIVFPPFRLDLRAEKLWCEEQEVALRPKTFAILRYLAQHPERLVSKAELLRAIWGEIQVSEDGLRDYIREIRKALSDNSASPRFVETALGRGYRFVAPLRFTTRVESHKSQVESQEEVASIQYGGVSTIEDGRLAGREKNGAISQQRPPSPLLTIRGLYDGKEIRALPTELLPSVSQETLVLIVFLENESLGKGNGKQEP